MTRPEGGPYFTVPAATTPTVCRSCGAAIYMVRQPSGKTMPVDCETPDGWKPVLRQAGDDDHGSSWPHEERDGSGVSHFATCPHAVAHRRT
jgi:hypothetical protein